MTPGSATVQRFYEAFCARDWEAMRAVFDESAELGVSGRNPFAGFHSGPDAIVAVFRDIVDQSAGTFRPVREDTWDVCASDHHIVLFEWFGAERGDRKLQAYLYFVCAVDADRIKRMFVHAVEQYDFDEFWS